MTALRDAFKEEMQRAMRESDSKALATVRLILAALKDRDIAARQNGANATIDDNEILLMLQSMTKQRRESIKAYEDAGRQELADAEAMEIALIEKFLPQVMNLEETQTAITEAIAETGAESLRDMGKVMGILRARYAGKMDFAAAAEQMKQVLGKN